MAALAEIFASLPWATDRRPIYDWAAAYVRLSGALAQSGKFDVTRSRHFIGPFEAIQNDLIRAVNILAPPRSGKTLIADMTVPWILANDPGSILYLFNTEPQAKEHCETRLRPILDACGPLQAILPNDRHKDRTQEIVFPNGQLLKVCGTSISNLQAKGYRYVIQDECWQYAPGIMTEAFARMGDFEKLGNNKAICISQGGEDGSEWDSRFAQGQLCEWMVPCLQCGEYQAPVWHETRDDGSKYGIVYESEKAHDGSYNVQRGAETARYVCKLCGHSHENSAKTRARWNAAGRYSAEPRSGAVSFHWNSIIDTDWGKLVETWLVARNAARLGFYEPIIKFFQKQLATHKSERTAMDYTQPIQRVEVGDKAVDGEHVFMSVDVQKDQLLYATVRAWKPDGTSRRLFRGKLYGFPEIERVRNGFGVGRASVIVDAGNWRYEVFSVAADNGYICAIGKDQVSFTHTLVDPKSKLRKQVQKPWSPMFYGDPDIGKSDRNDGRRARAFYLAQPVMADWLQRLIDTGKWTEPKIDTKTDAEEADYTAQMAAEIKRRERDKFGRLRERWVCPGNRDNHYLDTARMQVFAAMAKGLIQIDGAFEPAATA